MTKQTGFLVTWDEMSTMDATVGEQKTPPTGDKIVTKSESLSYYNWDADYLTNYGDNQCPPYEAFVPIAELISITYESSAVFGPNNCYMDNNGFYFNGKEQWFMGWDRTLSSGQVQIEDGFSAIYGIEGLQFTAKSYVDGRYSSWGLYTGCTTTVEVYEDNVLLTGSSVTFTNVSRPNASDWRVEAVVYFTPIPGKNYRIKTYNHNLQGPPDCDFIPSFTNVIIQTELEECLGSMEFILQYVENQGPCATLHNCNDATFYLRGNGIQIGTVYLSNTGGSNDRFNYPPGQNSGRNRYNTITLTTQQAQTLAASSNNGKITFDLICALSFPCHSNVTWITLKRNGTTIYNGCPANNFLTIDPCTGIVS